MTKNWGERMKEIELIQKLNDALNTVQDIMLQLRKMGYDAYAAEVTKHGTKSLAFGSGINELTHLFNCINPDIQLKQKDVGNYHCRSIFVNGLEIYQLDKADANNLVYVERNKNNDN